MWCYFSATLQTTDLFAAIRTKNLGPAGTTKFASCALALSEACIPH